MNISEFQTDVPSIEDQIQVREMLILQNFMEDHIRDPLFLVMIACANISKVLREGKTIEQALEVGEARLALEKLNRKFERSL